MQTFINENFMLGGKAAERLYHEYAATMPIFDYHCHLPVADIAGDIKFKNLTEAWLAGDHYKWRAMRSNGVAEKYITGDAPDYEKFLKWAATIPRTIRNPLYHWTHMELHTFFGITTLLDEKSAPQIYEQTTAMLQEDRFSARNLIISSNVKALCTTDDPCDDLAQHKALAADSSFPVLILPAFRPDKALKIDDPQLFIPWLRKLGQVSGQDISTYTDLIEALEARVDFFHAAGCRISDHGLEAPYGEDFTQPQVAATFAKALAGEAVPQQEALAYKSAVMYELARFYHARDWAMQLHVGVARNVNTRAYSAMGPDTGYDTIGGYPVALPLARFLDRLSREEALCKTVLYSINPVDNYLIGTILGCFQDGTIPGKIQFGSAWWFNDHKEGMIDQMNALSNTGLISRFIGMLTDSRSLLSYPRHDYFRRILCNLLGQDVQQGELPADYDLLGGIVQDICYNNAVNYFRIGNV